jgi:pyruvate/2-oxoacid:ferredoxin oxidoreductase alpha subunit
MTREMWEGNQRCGSRRQRRLKHISATPSRTQTGSWVPSGVCRNHRTFLRPSELGALNMVYGAACAGVRVMSAHPVPG